MFQKRWNAAPVSGLYGCLCICKHLCKLPYSSNPIEFFRGLVSWIIFISHYFTDFVNCIFVHSLQTIEFGMISNMKFVLFVNQLWEQGVNRTLPRLLNAALNTSNSDKRLFCRQVLRVWVNQIELFCAIPSSFWLQYDAVTCISISIYTVPSVTSTPFVFRDHLMQKAVVLGWCVSMSLKLSELADLRRYLVPHRLVVGK